MFAPLEPVEPIHVNLEEFLKCKTYVWSTYKSKEIMIMSDVYRDIEVVEHVIDKRNTNSHKIVLKHNNDYYVYKVNYESRLKAKDYASLKKENNFTFENGKQINVFIYPSTIFIVPKLIKSSHDFILETNLFVDVRHVLFQTEVATTKFKLITNNDYKLIKALSHSDYDKPVLPHNTIEKDEFIFKIFYHPDLMQEKDMAGIEFCSTNLNTVYNSEYRFCYSPKKKNKLPNV